MTNKKLNLKINSFRLTNKKYLSNVTGFLTMSTALRIAKIAKIRFTKSPNVSLNAAAKNSSCRAFKPQYIVPGTIFVVVIGASCFLVDECIEMIVS